jgi:hypothetical protein
MSKKSKKLGQVLEESGYKKLYIDFEQHNFVLVRENDNKQMPCGVVKYVEWNEDGTFKSVHNDMAVGRSVILDPGPFGQYQWLTTTITEILSETKFKTTNSIYNLYKL